MRHLRFILAVLALARWVGAQAVLGPPAVSPVEPTTQPAPVDPSAAVAAVQQLAATANAQLAAAQSEIANCKLQIANWAARPAPARVPFLLVNDEANQYGFVTRWADQTRSGSGFFDLSGGKQPFTYSGNGYPIGQTIHARSLVYMIGAPAGDYVVTWLGNATLQISGLGGVTYKPTGPDSGVITLPAEGQLAQNQYGLNPTEMVLIDVTSSDPASPLDQLHVWTPGYGPGSARAGQMYLDQYLALFRGGYGGVRTMNSSNANGSQEVNWSDRITPSMYDWTTRGVPIEAEIELIKESGVGAWWVCVPPKATSDYRQREAKLIHDALPPSTGSGQATTIIVEWGNEAWNSGGGFAANQLVASIASAKGSNPAGFDGQVLPATGSGPAGPGRWLPSPAGTFQTDDFTREARCAFDLARACAQDFAAAFADRPGQCLPAFGCQAGNPWWAQQAYAYGAARYGSVQPFKILSIAAYIDWWANNGFFYKEATPGADTVDDVFRSAFAFNADNTLAGQGLEYELAQHAAIARANGQEIDCYESGQHFYPKLVNGTYTGTDISTLAQTDPRMGFLIDDLYARLHRAGVRRACSFALIGSPWGKDGFWSLLRSYEEATSPNAYRWQADQRECKRSN